MVEKKQNPYAEVVQSCIEDKYFKDEIMLEHHSFVRILSGEMKVVQADNSYVFGAGDMLLFPRHQLSTLIKYPKEGTHYTSVVMTLTTQRLKEYYTKTDIVLNKKPDPPTIRTFDKHPLLESFFASLMPYFELQNELPENLIGIKIEEILSILRSLDHGIDVLLTDFSEPGKINLRDFMEQNFMFNMNIEKFAYLTGRSLTTFKRDFKKVFSTTPQKWITQKRLELAHHKMMHHGAKPMDVYLETGFENLSHFSFAFKKRFGHAPTTILEQHKS